MPPTFEFTHSAASTSPITTFYQIESFYSSLNFKAFYLFYQFHCTASSTYLYRSGDLCKSYHTTPDRAGKVLRYPRGTLVNLNNHVQLNSNFGWCHIECVITPWTPAIHNRGIKAIISFRLTQKSCSNRNRSALLTAPPYDPFTNYQHPTKRLQRGTIIQRPQHRLIW